MNMWSIGMDFLDPIDPIGDGGSPAATVANLVKSQVTVLYVPIRNADSMIYKWEYVLG
jgi:hypothetical protein